MALDSMKNTNPVKKLHPQIQEKIDYVSSPLYKRRLMALGQSKTDAENLIKERINVLKNTEIRPYQSTALGDWTGGGLASTDPKTGNPFIQYDITKPQSESIFAHELGHLTSGVVKPDNKYYPWPLLEGKESVSDAKKRLSQMQSQGTPMYMSPKEEMLFNLQNKNLNEILPKGSGYSKMTGGKTLNDYFYNSKLYGADWPLGTRVDVSEPKKEENNYNRFNFLNDEYVSGLPAPMAPVKKTMNLTKDKAYDYDYLSKTHDIGEQGIPKNRMATSLNQVFYGAFDPHTYSPTENKADLDAIRHLLKKYNYTSSYGDDITPELWQKALKDKKINQNEHLQRMRKNFDDKAIINLNNRVAYNASPLDSMKNMENIS